ncbi:MAG: transcriptional repressor [Prevotellaceae bacterium]|nr:transcriptional repressor [Prevotellaceae bacterium]
MITNIKSHLLNHKVKPSLQRMAIMRYLMENKTHPTADEIYLALHPVIPTLSKTTVYNTLKLLVEHGAVLNLSVDEKNARYDGVTKDHAHFKCLTCGAILDIGVRPSEAIYVKNIGDLKITEAQLMYKGYCSNCKNQQPQ